MSEEILINVTPMETRVELLYEDLPLHLRAIRDLVRPSVERLLIDNREGFTTLREFCGGGYRACASVTGA